MPKIKAPRSSPSLDMTPMVDLFFLLVTFFMLTATFRNEEPVMVDTPKSTSDKILPDNTMLITIDTAGRVFYTIDGQEVRYKLISDLGEQYKVPFSEQQKITFSKMTSVGLPVAELPAYIDMKAEKRKAIDKASKGIPMDTALTERNQLAFWINLGRRHHAAIQENKANEDPNYKKADLRFAIKADGETAYKKVKDVVAIFKMQDIYRFNLVTSQEAK